MAHPDSYRHCLVEHTKLPEGTSETSGRVSVTLTNMPLHSGCLLTLNQNMHQVVEHAENGSDL